MARPNGQTAEAVAIDNSIVDDLRFAYGQGGWAHDCHGWNPQGASQDLADICKDQAGQIQPELDDYMAHLQGYRESIQSQISDDGTPSQELIREVRGAMGIATNPYAQPEEIEDAKMFLRCAGISPRTATQFCLEQRGYKTDSPEWQLATILHKTSIGIDPDQQERIDSQPLGRRYEFGHPAAYHNPAHATDVVLDLALQDGVTDNDGIVFIAAMIHDAHHQGGSNRGQDGVYMDYYYEQRSIEAADVAILRHFDTLGESCPNDINECKYKALQLVRCTDFVLHGEAMDGIALSKHTTDRQLATGEYQAIVVNPDGTIPEAVTEFHRNEYRLASALTSADMHKSTNSTLRGNFHGSWRLAQEMSYPDGLGQSSPKPASFMILPENRRAFLSQQGGEHKRNHGNVVASLNEQYGLR